MTKELEQGLNQAKEQLSFEDASNLTIEEAVRKEADLKAGVTDKDGALDKYIKHHREEVSNQKFSNLDTGSLDKFIKSQRQKLEDEGVLPAGVETEESLADKAKNLGLAGAAAVGAGLTAGGAKLAQSGSDVTGKAKELAEQVTDKGKDLVDGLAEKTQGIKADLTNLGTDITAKSKDLKPADSQFLKGFEQQATADKEQLEAAGQAAITKTGDLSKETVAKTAAALAAGGAAVTGAAALAKGAKDDLLASGQASASKVLDTGRGLTKEAAGTLAAGGAAVAGAATGFGKSSKDILAEENLLADPSVLTEKPGAKNKKLVIGALAAILLGTVGLGYGLNHLNKSANSAVASSSSSASSASKASSASSAVANKDVKAFDDLYASFFADKAASKPKNSEFGNLSKLEEALKKLEGTADYDAAKSKYDSLKKMVTAIQAINDKFETDAIVDGEKVEATLKEGANFDDLKSDVLNTGKASLDTLIQAVLAEGRDLASAGGGRLTAAGATGANAVSDSAGATADNGSAPAAESSVAQSASNEPAQETAAPAAPAPVVVEAAPLVDAAPAPVVEAAPVIETAPIVSTPADAGIITAPPIQVVNASGQTVTVADPNNLPAGHVVAPTYYGLISYNPSSLQRELSRVPFNVDLIADKANPAWAFKPGVMEEIIRVSQQRGYITGYNFILEPVNIVNGNGYYNMYKPDGTYLFSINAKTGYFVGNGSGYADALDY